MIHVAVGGFFPLGRIVITKRAHDAIDACEVLSSLERHVQCDWGELSEEDKALNDLALVEGERILSAYTDARGTTFWIITEWNRSVTTILLPDDY